MRLGWLVLVGPSLFIDSDEIWCALSPSVFQPSHHPFTQVTGVFARRGYNVQSLAVGPSEKKGMSRICMVVPGDDSSIAKLLKQLNKLVFVQKVADLTNLPFIKRELLLVKVRPVSLSVHCQHSARWSSSSSPLGELQHGAAQRAQAPCRHLPRRHPRRERHQPHHRGRWQGGQAQGPDGPARAVRWAGGLCQVGHEMRELTRGLFSIRTGILEIARTGRIALSRESGLDNEFLNKNVITRVF